MDIQELEKLIDRAKDAKQIALSLINNQLTSLPESIGKLTNLQYLCLERNQIAYLPEAISQLINLRALFLDENKLIELPNSIGELINLRLLILSRNNITYLPDTLEKLTSLTKIALDENPLSDLTPLQLLSKLRKVWFLDVELPRRYWTKLSDWQPEWLLDEDNVELRRVLIQQLGYDKICDRLGAIEIDTWREYTLLKIDNVEIGYDEDGVELDDREPMVLLKMTCPSTKHIHVLRVPPDMTSAEDAITWVNHDIHPDEFVMQT
jgi:leucine-rich repeat protein SHOC2